MTVRPQKIRCLSRHINFRCHRDVCWSTAKEENVGWRDIYIPFIDILSMSLDCDIIQNDLLQDKRSNYSSQTRLGLKQAASVLLHDYDALTG